MVKGQRDSKRERFWRQTLAQFASSGLNIRDFCRQAKVTEASFYAWRRTIQQRDAEQRRPATRTRQSRTTGRHQSPPSFVPLVVRDDPAGGADSSTITINLSDGRRRRVLRLPATIPAERLAEFVRAVESIPVVAEHRP